MRGIPYTLQSGDTLGSIARAKLGDVKRWVEIAALNQDILPDPNRVVVGMTLVLPPVDPTQKLPPTTPPLQGLFWPERFPGRVALTFDDGPHPVNTPKVLDILKRSNVKATFFILGENARKYPVLVRRIVSEGHSLGHHSDTHPNFTEVDREELGRQLDRAQAAVDEALGRPYPMLQVRPPYGAMDLLVKDVIRSRGHMAVMWNVDSRDWRFRKEDARIVQSIFATTGGIQSRGGSILFHDIHPQTVRVLGEVITRLKRLRLTIVKTDELLRQKYPSPAPSPA
jgi:peptidoglycan/xylan/chitin deacetylase (PgdA/CDA1 family)